MLKIIKLAEIALEVPELKDAVILEIEKEVKILKINGYMQEVVRLAQDKGKLSAVKYLKDQCGGTLMECKKAVESKMEELGLKCKVWE